MTSRGLIQKLEKERVLTNAGLVQLIQGLTPDDEKELFARARAVREAEYGKAVYVRGLI